jgi:hypothetical protein
LTKITWVYAYSNSGEALLADPRSTVTCTADLTLYHLPEFFMAFRETTLVKTSPELSYDFAKKRFVVYGCRFYHF